MTDHTTPEIEVDENQLIAERQKKLSLIRDTEGPTFPNDFRRSHLALGLAQSTDLTIKRHWLRKV